MFYFDELNLRTGASGAAVLKAGVNLPAMFVRTMCGKSTDDMAKQVIQPATFVNEKLAFDDFVAGNLSLREYRRLLATADILFVKDEQDAAPYNELNRQLRKKTFSCKRIIKLLFSKK